MDATASLLNLYFSIEKFLWDNIASTASELLINSDDLATRQEELLKTDKAVVWRTQDSFAGNKGELTLYVGAATIRDPGGLQRLLLLNKIKEAFDSAAGISVWSYENTGLITDPAVRVNELAVIGPITIWPAFTDPNIMYTTKYISQKLKFAQIRT